MRYTTTLQFNECLAMPEFNHELCNQFEYEVRILGHATQQGDILFWEMYPEYIT
jgi:hypothetical protein